MDTTFRLASNFKGILDIVSGLVDTMSINYNENGLNIQCIDSSHISMLCLGLRRDQFLQYELVVPGTISFNVSSLKPPLKSMKEGDHFRIRHKTGSDEVDVFLMDGDRKNKYVIKLLDIDCENMSLPDDMEHETFITTSKPALSRILSDIKNVDSNETIFQLEGEKIVIEAVGDQCRLKIKPGQETMRIMTPIDEQIRIQFASKYILHIQKMLGIAKPRLIMRMDREKPLLIEMTMRTEDENVNGTSGQTINKTQSFIKYYLAPKIEDH